MGERNDYNWYLTLISILFALFIAAWMGPAREMIFTYPDAALWDNAQQAKSQLARASQIQSNMLTAISSSGSTTGATAAVTNCMKSFDELKAATSRMTSEVDRWFNLQRDWPRLILVPLVLMCLWWWYGIFLGRLNPARSFVLYVLDFSTLTVFALGARFWNIDFMFASLLLVAIALMLSRLSLLKWVPLNPQERDSASQVIRLLRVCFFAFGLFFCGYLAGARQEWIPQELLHISINIILTLGIIVTVRAAWRTEGLSPFAFARREPPSQLTLRIALPLSEVHKLETNNLHELLNEGEERFAGFLSTQTLIQPLYETHLSLVHSSHDTQCQACLACLPSIHQPSEMAEKIFWTYFAHWVDDVCDTPPRVFSSKNIAEFTHHGRLGSLGFLQRTLFARKHRVAELLSAISTPDSSPRLQLPIAVRPLQVIGLQRLIMGSVLFGKNRRVRDTIRALHSRYIDEQLMKEGKRLADFQTHCSEALIHLTAKSVQEIWLPVENNPEHTFYFTFLYSLLYAPAIYSHNIRAEQELEGFSEECTLPEAEACGGIRAVSDMIVADHQRKPDPRLAYRIWQLHSMLQCFARVLPQRIASAYREAAIRLETSCKSMSICRAVYASDVAAIEVTEEVRSLMSDGALDFVVGNKHFKDPHVGVRKALTIEYYSGGTGFKHVFQEGVQVRLP